MKPSHLIVLTMFLCLSTSASAKSDYVAFKLSEIGKDTLLKQGSFAVAAVPLTAELNIIATMDSWKEKRLSNPEMIAKAKDLKKIADKDITIALALFYTSGIGLDDDGRRIPSDLCEYLFRLS